MNGKPDLRALPDLPEQPKVWTVVEFVGDNIVTVARGVTITEAGHIVGKARGEGRHLMTQRNEDARAAEARRKTGDAA